MEIDTGASVSLISEQTWKNTSAEQLAPLKPTAVKLMTYTGDEVKELQVNVEAPDGQQLLLPLIVVRGNGPSLLGRDWLRQIRLDWRTIHEVRQEKSDAEVEKVLDETAQQRSF